MLCSAQPNISRDRGAACQYCWHFDLEKHPAKCTEEYFTSQLDMPYAPTAHLLMTSSDRHRLNAQSQGNRMYIFVDWSARLVTVYLLLLIDNKGYVPALQSLSGAAELMWGEKIQSSFTRCWLSCFHTLVLQVSTGNFRDMLLEVVTD